MAVVTIPCIPIILLALVLALVGVAARFG